MKKEGEEFDNRKWQSALVGNNKINLSENHSKTSKPFNGKKSNFFQKELTILSLNKYYRKKKKIPKKQMKLNINKKKQSIETIAMNLYYVLKFVKNLKRSVELNSLEKITDFPFKIIQDLSYFPKFKNYYSKELPKSLQNQFKEIRFTKQKKLKNKIKRILYGSIIKNEKLINYKKKKKEIYKKFLEDSYPLYKYFDKNVKVFEPNGLIILIWDIIYFSLLIVSVFYTPIKIGFFYFEDDPKFSKIFNYSIYFFIFDIFVKMNTGIFDQGEVVFQRSKVLKNYFKSQFLLDIITLFPYIINFFYFHSKLLQLILLLRSLQLKKLVNKFVLRFELKERDYHILDLIKLFFLIFYVTNLCACSWHFIGTIVIHYRHEDSWLSKNNLADEPFHIRYIESLYLSVSTMITSGGFSTTNFIEQIISIFIMVILSGMFAYSINILGSILQEINQNDKEFRLIIVYF